MPTKEEIARAIAEKIQAHYGYVMFEGPKEIIAKHIALISGV